MIPLTGAGEAVIEGSDQLYLEGTSTYTGGTSIGYTGSKFSSVLNFTNGSFGSGPIYFSNANTAAMVVIGNGAVTIPNAVTNVQTNINPQIFFNIVANPAGVNFTGPWNFTGGGAKPSAQMNLSAGGAANNLLTISGGIFGTNGFVKYGAGMLELTGANTYGKAGTVLGSTWVSNGWLILANTTGSAAGVSSVIITNSGSTGNGTLTGSGSMTGTVTNNGKGAISATNMAGGCATLTTGAQTWQPGSHYTWGINNATGTAGATSGWDLLNVNGGVTINATSGNKLSVDITSLTATGAAGPLASFVTTNDYSWPILTATGAISGISSNNITITSSGFGNALGGGFFTLTNVGSTVYMLFVAPPVPGAFAIGATAGNPVSVPAGKIASLGTSPSGGTLTISSVTSPTAGGAIVTLTNGILTYSNASVGSDTINYVLSDGYNTAAGSIFVMITSGSGGTQNGLTITPNGPNANLQFYGIPGQPYYIQVSSPNANGPWTDLPNTPVTADSLGEIDYTVISPVNPSFYRTSINP